MVSSEIFIYNGNMQDAWQTSIHTKTLFLMLSALTHLDINLKEMDHKQ